MSRRELIVRGPTYFSPGDEKIFFDWLQSIPCVEQVRGHLRDLHITLKRPPSNSDIDEFVALFHRYRMDMMPLVTLEMSTNRRTFSKAWAVQENGSPIPETPEEPPERTAADYYGFFMTGLFGTVDDAELSGYNQKGIELLRQARELFWDEFKRLHPGAWDQPKKQNSN